MGFQNEPTWLQSGVNGQMPAQWAGVDLPDGDRVPWVSVPIGSLYMYKPSEVAAPRFYQKRAVNDRDDDWGLLGGNHVLQQRVTRAEFTDGGSASGTFVLTEKIPVGAWVEQVILKDVTGFTGNTSATLTVGDGTDPDRYNTGTPSVFTTALAIDMGVPSGTKVHVTEATVTLTIAGNSDFTSITAGAFTICIHYKL